jgi:hypothetical protein
MYIDRTVTHIWAIRSFLLFFVVEMNWKREFLSPPPTRLIFWIYIYTRECVYINICLCKIHPIDYHMKNRSTFLFFIYWSVVARGRRWPSNIVGEFRCSMVMLSEAKNSSCWFILITIYISIHFLYIYICNRIYDGHKTRAFQSPIKKKEYENLSMGSCHEK